VLLVDETAAAELPAFLHKGDLQQQMELAMRLSGSWVKEIIM
jgi:hypothetical protein